MKILIGLSYYYPNLSGLTIYAKKLAEGLVEKGYEVEIITSRHDSKLKSKDVINGVKIIRLWTPLIFGRGPVMPTYALSAFLLVFKSNIVNCHLPSFEAIILCLWAKILRKKIIITYQCDLAGWSGFINQITEKAALASQYITCFFANKIVASSSDYADNSFFLRKFKNKLVYIYPPVKVIDSKIDTLKNWHDTKYKIGFVGRIAKEKGIEYFLMSIDFLKVELSDNFKIFFVGPSKDVVGGGYQDKIGVLIKKYKRHLVFLGKLSDKELFGFYKQIDVLVLPSVESLEAFGMVQVEAMLSGTPVVASDIPGARIPVLKTGMGKIVKAKDAKALAEAIISVLKNKKKLVLNKTRVEKMFNYENTIAFYADLFSR